MTYGEIYNLNKGIYNQEAKIYINKYLPNIGDIAYIPFSMKTHYSRIVVKKLSDKKFIWFSAIVEEIKPLENGININYNGEILECKEMKLNRLIDSFGFEISINPRSKSNKIIQDEKRKNERNLSNVRRQS